MTDLPVQALGPAATCLDRQVSRVRRALTACAAHGLDTDNVTLIVRPDGITIQIHPHRGEDVAVGILAQLADEAPTRGDHTGATAFSVYHAGDFEVYADLHPDARPAEGA